MNDINFLLCILEFINNNYNFFRPILISYIILSKKTISERPLSDN